MRNFMTYEWLTVVIILCLLSLAIVRSLYSTRFKELLILVVNSRYLKMYSKDQKFIDYFDGFLFFNLSFSASIVIFFGYSFYVEPLTFNVLLYLKIVFAFISLILSKILIERLIGSLFQIDAIIDSYLFQKIAFKNYSGLLFLLCSLILIYTDIPVNFTILTTIVAIFLINAIGFLSSLKAHQKLIITNLFYFLLYLCALEIGPYVVLYKVLKDYFV